LWTSSFARTSSPPDPFWFHNSKFRHGGNGEIKRSQILLRPDHFTPRAVVILAARQRSPRAVRLIESIGKAEKIIYREEDSDANVPTPLLSSRANLKRSASPPRQP
jgi:hypothetical protein